MEGSDGPIRGNARSVFALQQALQAVGIEFLERDGTGVLLRSLPARGTVRKPPVRSPRRRRALNE
jgi:hypothetical protein